MHTNVCQSLKTVANVTYFSVLYVVATSPDQTQTTPPTGGLPAGGLFRDGTYLL